MALEPQTFDLSDQQPRPGTPITLLLDHSAYETPEGWHRLDSRLIQRVWWDRGNPTTVTVYPPATVTCGLCDLPIEPGQKSIDVPGADLPTVHHDCFTSAVEEKVSRPGGPADPARPEPAEPASPTPGP